MVGRCLVALVCLAGCDHLFDLQHVDKLPPDATVDARSIDTRIDAGFCPATYTLHVPGYSPAYRYESQSTMWDVAEALCANDSSGKYTHLVVLDDDQERTDLIKALVTFGNEPSGWIGFSDRKQEGIFRWVTDAPVGIPPQQNPPWPPGQPDNLGGAQNCVRIQGLNDPSPGLFDDKECSFYEPYVCECDEFPPNPTNF